MSTKSIPEVFAERVVGVAHANGVYRITLAQQDESDQLRPVARLLIPESQAESMLQGIAAGIAEIQNKIEQGGAAIAQAPADKAAAKTTRKPRTKSKKR